MLSYGVKLLIGGIGLELSWLQSIIIGLISGIAEVLPVSARAHRLLLLKMFGVGGEGAILRLLVHISVAAALYFCCRSHLMRMLRAQRIARIPKKRRKRPLDSEGLTDFSLLKTALIPVILAFLLYSKISVLVGKPVYIAALLMVNGFILYIPQYLPGSNKTSGAMTRIDALFFGLGGALATLPGISCIGSTVSIASVRGMDLKKALNLALLLNIAMNIGFAVFDLMELLGGGGGSISFSQLLSSILAGITAFAGVILGIRVLHKITENIGYSVFGFYSWGMALLTFILFLAAV